MQNGLLYLIFKFKCPLLVKSIMFFLDIILSITMKLLQNMIWKNLNVRPKLKYHHPDSLSMTNRNVKKFAVIKLWQRKAENCMI